MNFLNLFFPKEVKQKLRITKSDGEWIVMRGHEIMFFGSREMCKNYIEANQAA